jgi:hypothetical protein
LAASIVAEHVPKDLTQPTPVQRRD